MFHYSVLNKENCQHSGSGTGPVVKMAAYLDQTGRNFFAEQEYGQVNTGDLFNRRTRLAADGLFAGKTKPSAGYTARFVPLEGGVSQTPSMFSSQNDFF
jgi:hypothetical protein